MVRSPMKKRKAKAGGKAKAGVGAISQAQRHLDAAIKTHTKIKRLLSGDREEFVCPFCGLKAWGFPTGAVMHTEPRCEKFDRLEPDRYLWEVNEKLGNHSKAN